MTSLNPVHTVGQQIVEAILAHSGCRRGRGEGRAVEMLELVGIPARRIDDYPHNMSGGMRQRVMIAMALACEPALLIADEPTTALDVTIQAQILDLLRDLQRELGMAILIITHDLGVIAEIADEVVVMYAGKIVERAVSPTVRRSAASLHDRPAGSIPALDRPRERLPPSRARCRDREQPADGLPLRAALPVRRRTLPRDPAAAARDDAGASRGVLESARWRWRMPTDRCRSRSRSAWSNTSRAPRLSLRQGSARCARSTMSLRDRARRDAGAGRRIRLRQVDHGRGDAAADRARPPARSASRARRSRARQARCARMRRTCRSSSRTRTRRSIRA